MRIANYESDAKTPRTMVGMPRWGVRTAQRAVPTCEIMKTPIQVLPLRFLDLFPDLLLFATNIAQMALEKW
jgi:hypothetical protein